MDQQSEAIPLDENTLPPVTRLAHKATKIGKLSTIYAVGAIVPMFINMLLLPVFTHYLVPAQMGIVALANQLILPICIIIQLGLWSSLRSHYFRLEESLHGPVVRTVLIGQSVQTGSICLLMSLVGIFIAPHMLPNLPVSSAKVFGLWLIIVWSGFFVAVVRLGTGLSQLRERALTALLIAFLQYVLTAGLGVIVVVGFGWQGFGRQSMMFVGIAVAAVVSFRVVWRYGSGGFQWTLFKRVFFTGLSFLPHGLTAVLALTLNAWLVNRLVDAAALGVYGIAIRFGMLIEVTLVSFGNASYPTLAKLLADGGPEARRQLSRLYTLFVAAIVVLALGVSLFSSIAIHFLTSAQYHAAKSVVPALALTWSMYGLYWIAANRIFFLGKGLWLTVATLASAVTAVVLSIVLIPAFGLYGAAAALAGSFLVRFVVAFALGERVYAVPWQVRPMLCVLACGLLLGLVDFWVSPRLSLWASVIFKTALFLSIVPLAWLSGVVNRKEIAFALELLRQKLGGTSGGEAG
ncbi:MAG: hypothetical protein AMS16_05715 [Planctomycetes bacterium DG_58]|nr:MAG: hypothetical protein AMS16_05715 [Planctomycetes bacterium DG_58]KPL04947.1 MAG: hypothetical protein AMK75_00180 [Planctomycetes bacterium SM23_65]